MKITIENKEYEIESAVEFDDWCFNVNGTTITDFGGGRYTVYVNGDEIVFYSFADAYKYATTKQKDGCSFDEE